MLLGWNIIYIFYIHCSKIVPTPRFKYKGVTAALYQKE